MAIRPILIRRPPEAVWDVLSDGHRYADWVVGTYDSHPLDGRWPTEGSTIQYVVRVGPWRLSGTTVVRLYEPGQRLELEARSGAIGTARIAIEVRPWGADTLVIVDEHPLGGPGGRMHNWASEALLQVRHRHMLRQLARVVEEDARPRSAARNAH